MICGDQPRIRFVHLPTPLEAAPRLSEALGEPSHQLVFWLEDKGRWVDSEGHKVELPENQTGRAWTAVELEGRRVGAIVHDLTLSEDPELLRSVAAAAGLAIYHLANPPAGEFRYLMCSQSVPDAVIARINQAIPQTQ